MFLNTQTILQCCQNKMCPLVLLKLFIMLQVYTVHLHINFLRSIHSSLTEITYFRLKTFNLVVSFYPGMATVVRISLQLSLNDIRPLRQTTQRLVFLFTSTLFVCFNQACFIFTLSSTVWGEEGFVMTGCFIFGYFSIRLNVTVSEVNFLWGWIFVTQCFTVF